MASYQKTRRKLQAAVQALYEASRACPNNTAAQRYVYHTITAAEQLVAEIARNVRENTEAV